MCLPTSRISTTSTGSARQERGKKFCLGEAYGNQQATNKEQFARLSMPNRFGDENDRGQEQQRKGDSPMESAEFRFDPRIQMTL
jgi:hypothetical protein